MSSSSSEEQQQRNPFLPPNIQISDEIAKGVVNEHENCIASRSCLAFRIINAGMEDGIREEIAARIPQTPFYLLKSPSSIKHSELLEVPPKFAPLLQGEVDVRIFFNTITRLKASPNQDLLLHLLRNNKLVVGIPPASMLRKDQKDWKTNREHALLNCTEEMAPSLKKRKKHTKKAFLPDTTSKESERKEFTPQNKGAALSTLVEMAVLDNRLQSVLLCVLVLLEADHSPTAHLITVTINANQYTKQEAALHLLQRIEHSANAWMEYTASNALNPPPTLSNEKTPATSSSSSSSSAPSSSAKPTTTTTNAVTTTTTTTSTAAVKSPPDFSVAPNKASTFLLLDGILQCLRALLLSPPPNEKEDLAVLHSCVSYACRILGIHLYLVADAQAAACCGLSAKQPLPAGRVETLHEQMCAEDFLQLKLWQDVLVYCEDTSLFNAEACNALVLLARFVGNREESLKRVLFSAVKGRGNHYLLELLCDYYCSNSQLLSRLFSQPEEAERLVLDVLTTMQTTKQGEALSVVSNAPPPARVLYCLDKLGCTRRSCLVRLYHGRVITTLHAGSVSAAAMETGGDKELVFDEARTAETITISKEGRRCTQKVEKKWGTCVANLVLSKKKKFVWRWKIVVDKCEEGHIFFGVATRDVSTSSYLGEDKEGWGFIGKGHLWHNKEKKGSYGELVRTGDTVFCTLDFTHGTLSFARNGKEYGVAFAGLDTNVEYYPAIALFEKGDGVSLGAVVTEGGGNSPTALGASSVEYSIASWSFVDKNKNVFAALRECLKTSFLSTQLPPSEMLKRHFEALLAMQSTSGLLSLLPHLLLWNVFDLPTALGWLQCVQAGLASYQAKNRTATQPPSDQQDSLFWVGKWMAYYFAASGENPSTVVDLKKAATASNVATELFEIKLGDSPDSPALVGFSGERKLGGVFFKGSKLVLVDGKRVLRARAMPENKRVLIGWVNQIRKNVVFIRPKLDQEAGDAVVDSFRKELEVENLLSLLYGRLAAFILTLNKPVKSEAASDNERDWMRGEVFKQGFIHKPNYRALLDSLGAVGGEAKQEKEEEERGGFLFQFQNGEFAQLDRYMLRHVANGALAAIGGPLLTKMRHKVMAASLHHLDVADEAKLVNEFLLSSASVVEDGSLFLRLDKCVDGGLDDELPVGGGERVRVNPSKFMVEVWKGGLRTAASAIREKQTSGSFESFADRVIKRSEFLLRCDKSSAVLLDYEPDADLASADVRVVRLNSLRMFLREKTRNNTVSSGEIIDTCVGFVGDSQLDLAGFQKAMMDLERFKALRRFVLETMLGEMKKTAHVKYLSHWFVPCLRSPDKEEPKDELRVDFFGEEEDAEVAKAHTSSPALSSLDFDDLGLIPSAEGELLRKGKAPVTLGVTAASLPSAVGGEWLDFLAQRLVECADEDEVRCLIYSLSLGYSIWPSATAEVGNVLAALRGKTQKILRANEGADWSVGGYFTLDFVTVQMIVKLLLIEGRGVNDATGNILVGLFAELGVVVKSIKTAVKSPAHVYAYHLLSCLNTLTMKRKDGKKDFEFLQPLAGDASNFALLLSLLGGAHEYKVRQRALRILRRLAIAAAQMNSSSSLPEVLTSLCDMAFAARADDPEAKNLLISETVSLLRRLFQTSSDGEALVAELIRARQPVLPYFLGSHVESLRVGCVTCLTPSTAASLSLSSDSDGEHAFRYTQNNQLVAVVSDVLDQGASFQVVVAATSVDGEAGKMALASLTLSAHALICVPEVPLSAKMVGKFANPLMELFERADQPGQDRSEELDAAVREVGVYRTLPRVLFGATRPVRRESLSLLLAQAVRPSLSCGVGDLHTLLVWYKALVTQWQRVVREHEGNATGESNNAATAASGAFQEALERMLNLDFPRDLSEIALRKFDNDVEAAINYCVEENANRTRSESLTMEKLKEMGFAHSWCLKAFEVLGSNVGFDGALTWILANGDLLQELDDFSFSPPSQQPPASSAVAALAGGGAGIAIGKSVSKIIAKSGWGVTTISPDNVVIAKSVQQGFPSVVLGDFLDAEKTSSKFYYEVVLHSEGCMQIGFADAMFTGSVSDGNGVGDDLHSFAYDGFRKLKWHDVSQPWGKTWKVNDVIGCAIDFEEGKIFFSHNGSFDAPMGLAFAGLKKDLHYCRGLTPAVSLNQGQKIKFNLTKSSFIFAPPSFWKPEEWSAVVVENGGGTGGKTESDDVVSLFSNLPDCFEEVQNDSLSDRFFNPDVGCASNILSLSTVKRQLSTGSNSNVVGGSRTPSPAVGGAAPGISFPVLNTQYPGQACSLVGGSPAKSLKSALKELTDLVEKTDLNNSMDVLFNSLKQTAALIKIIYARIALFTILREFNSPIAKSFVSLVREEETEMEKFFSLLKLSVTCSNESETFACMIETNGGWGNSAVKEDNENNVLGVFGDLLNHLITTSPNEKIKQRLCLFIGKQLSLACNREFSFVPFHDFSITPMQIESIWIAHKFDIPPTAYFFTDSSILELPMVNVAASITNLFFTPANPLPSSFATLFSLFQCWVLTLRSPNTYLKMVACQMLIKMLFKFFDNRHEFKKEEVYSILALFPKERIRNMAKLLMSRGGGSNLLSTHSKYSLTLIELNSVLEFFNLI